jgi:hypothetical protein
VPCIKSVGRLFLIRWIGGRMGSRPKFAGVTETLIRENEKQESNDAAIATLISEACRLLSTVI